MDATKIKAYAEELERLLEKYAKMDKNAELLYRSLRDLIAKAKSGAIKEPLEFGKIPGDWLFSETRLSDNEGLEGAYAKFKLAISNGDSPHVQRALEMIRKIQAKNEEQ